MAKSASSDLDAPKEAIAELVVGLTERERRFADAFFEVALETGTDIGASAVAYRRAFPATEANDQNIATSGRALIANERVRQHVAYLRRSYSSRCLVPVERVKEEIERVAFANILDFMTIDEKTGEAKLDLRALNSRSASAIAEITVDELERPDGYITRKIKLKLNSKMDALDKLARIHGIYQDKLNVQFTVEELDNAIAMMERKVEEQRRLSLTKPAGETMQ